MFILILFQELNITYLVSYLSHKTTLQSEDGLVGWDGDAVGGDDGQVHVLDVVGDHGAQQGQGTALPEGPIALDFKHGRHLLSSISETYNF